MRFKKFMFLLVCFFMLAQCGDDHEDNKNNNGDKNNPPQNQENTSSKDSKRKSTDQEIALTSITAKIEWLTPLKSGRKNICKANLLIITDDKKNDHNIEITDFDPQMPSMGHGTDRTAQVTTKLEDHKFLVEGIYFNMGGEWEITITAKVDGKTFKTSVWVDVD